jgi:hypothetical protein
MNTLHDEFNDWLVENKIVDRFNAHAKKVSTPIPLECQFWADLLIEFSNANAWAEDAKTEAEIFEIKALAAATEDGTTLSRAKGKCTDYIRWHAAIRRLARSASNRVMAVQSRMKAG